MLNGLRTWFRNAFRTQPGTPTPRAGRRPRGRAAATAPAVGAYAYDGPVSTVYAPSRDGDADPGEVVWAWVPFEEDATQGKDRPVVVVGTADSARAGDLAVLMLSSKDHFGDPDWIDIGTGEWDRQGRPSAVRLDRVLAVAPTGVRREGAILDRTTFDAVVRAAARRHGWA